MHDQARCRVIVQLLWKQKKQEKISVAVSPLWRWCQSNANPSLLPDEWPLSGGQKLAPFEESGVTFLLESGS